MKFNKGQNVIVAKKEIDIRIKANITYFDYHGLIGFLKRKTYKFKEMAGLTLADNIVGKTLIFRFINSSGPELINPQLKKKANISVVSLAVDEYSPKHLSVSIECRAGDINELFRFINALMKTGNDSLDNIIVNSVNVIREIVPNDMKIVLINRLFNDSKDDICIYASKLISEHFRTNIADIEFAIS